MFLKYAMIRDVEYPSRGHATDAGIDFYVPRFGNEFIKDLLEKNPHLHVDDSEKLDSIRLSPGQSVLIPSGIKVEIPYGYMGLFLNKSGVASKKKLLVGAQVIDTFYSGEVHINLHNVGDNVVDIRPNDKVVQMVMTPVLSCDLTLCEEDALYDWMKEDQVRGAGGFGSTDLKQENERLRSEIFNLKEQINNRHIYENATGS